MSLLPGRTATRGGDLPLAEGAWRQLDYWVTVYLRTWRGTVMSSFVTPLFYVEAMGVLLGGFIPGNPATLEGASSYLAFVVPGLVASQAMQTAVGETTWPVTGMIKWQRVYYSMIATPLEVPHLVAAHLGFVLFRLVTSCGVFFLVLAPFGVFASWWGALLAFLAVILVGLAFATLVYGFSARVRSEEAFGVLYRLAIFPMFLFSGAFFPIANLGPVLAWVARLTPLWHGVDLARMCTVGVVDWPLAVAHVLVLVALTGVGWFWSVRGLRDRLAG